MSELSAFQLPNAYHLAFREIRRYVRWFNNLDTRDCNPDCVDDPKYRLLHRVGISDRQIEELFGNQDINQCQEWLLKMLPTTPTRDGAFIHKKSKMAEVVNGIFNSYYPSNDPTIFLNKNTISLLLEHPTTLGAEILGHALQRMIGRNQLNTMLGLRHAAMHTQEPSSKSPWSVSDTKAVHTFLKHLYNEFGKDEQGRALGYNTLAQKTLPAARAMGQTSLMGGSIMHLLASSGAISDGMQAVILANTLSPDVKFSTVEELEAAAQNLPPSQKQRS